MTAVTDSFVLQLLLLGNHFLDQDASKWDEYKQQMEAIVEEKIVKAFEITPETRSKLTDFMNRLGQTTPPQTEADLQSEIEEVNAA